MDSFRGNCVSSVSKSVTNAQLPVEYRAGLANAVPVAHVATVATPQTLDKVKFQPQLRIQGQVRPQGQLIPHAQAKTRAPEAGGRASGVARHFRLNLPVVPKRPDLSLPIEARWGRGTKIVASEKCCLVARVIAVKIPRALHSQRKVPSKAGFVLEPGIGREPKGANADYVPTRQRRGRGILGRSHPYPTGQGAKQ